MELLKNKNSSKFYSISSTRPSPKWVDKTLNIQISTNLSLTDAKAPSQSHRRKLNKSDYLTH